MFASPGRLDGDASCNRGRHHGRPWIAASQSAGHALRSASGLPRKRPGTIRYSARRESAGVPQRIRRRKAAFHLRLGRRSDPGKSRSGRVVRGPCPVRRPLGLPRSCIRGGCRSWPEAVRPHRGSSRRPAREILGWGTGGATPAPRWAPQHRQAGSSGRSDSLRVRIAGDDQADPAPERRDPPRNQSTANPANRTKTARGGRDGSGSARLSTRSPEEEIGAARRREVASRKRSREVT